MTNNDIFSIIIAAIVGIIVSIVFTRWLFRINEAVELQNKILDQLVKNNQDQIKILDELKKINQKKIKVKKLNNE